MKLRTTTTAAILSLGAMCVADAALLAWQTEVGIGTAASATEFSTTSTPTTINVGTTAATAMSFEFIVNADNSTVAAALMGDRDTAANNQQSLRFEQYNNSGNYGITQFGAFGDQNSGVALANGTDIHLAFTTDGTDTLLYVDGTLAFTFVGNAINISGVTGLGGDFRDPGFTDVLPGDILGFAAYDSQLGAAEIQTHRDAFVAPVPEPSSAALLGLGGLALIIRRRK